MEQNAHNRHDAQETGTAAAPVDAAAERDPTLAELEALENEVDNWLRPPARVAPAPVAPAPVEAAPLAAAQVEATEAGPIEAATVEAAPVDAAPPEATLQRRAFQPDAAPAPAPGPRPRMPWRGLAIAAALAVALGVAMIANSQKSSDYPQEAVATDARDAAPPAVPAAPVAPESKPVEMVFLKDPAAAGATVAEPPVQPADQETVEAGPPSDAELEDAAPAMPAPVKAQKAAAVKKPIVRRTTASVTADRPEIVKAGRGASDRERLDKAIIQCNSNSRDPGACNLRACDVLGPSHPACRE